MADLAPAGVPLLPLGEIGEFIRGRRFTKADYVESGIGSIHYGEIYTDYGTTTSSVHRFVRPELAGRLRLARPGDLVIAATGENVQDVCRAVAWLGDEEIAVHDDCYILRHNLDPTFMAYFFQSARFHEQKMRFASESKLARVSGANLAKIIAPAPPMEVQREIVKVLDSFGALQAELEEELKAELQARRAQFVHYRDALLAFDANDSLSLSLSANVRWTTLSDICSRITSGATPTAGRPEYYQNGTIPWLRTSQVRFADIYDTELRITEQALRETAAKWIPADCVIVAISGATAARAAVNKIPLTTNQHCCNLEIDPAQAHYRYVFHWVSRHYEAIKALGQGARSDLNARLIKGFKIALPRMEDQVRIASSLDKFDALVNDLSIGLPAEIEARRQQYEHYRDRLLTFDEAVA